MNKHIVVGENNRCLCGMFEGKALGCTDIIKSIEICKWHGQSWDGGLLARLFETLIKDVDVKITASNNEIKPVIPHYDYENIVSEQGRDGVLWTLFETVPFGSRRIATFATEADARYFIELCRQYRVLAVKG